ncbi:MAG: glutamine synthetase III [Oscillospiraceae bacterium]
MVEMPSSPLSNFGELVFNNRVMQERLPKDVYKRMRKTMEEGKSLDANLAGIVANAMKDWALSKGVTHYTHWFQPMTGITAEKHDSFIAPTGDGGIIMEFSGKELIQGEPDASSFPSGGLRATFEARGYTAWDPTSPAFIKEGTLCIPTAFCSYGGDALDKKVPLLRSMEAIGRTASRLLAILEGDGCEPVRVVPTVGPEQEYFLVDKELWAKRDDLKFCGRTLFGTKPPKGQDLEDHYYGAIKARVHTFMKDLDDELWKLGILAKTEHNEVAPAQHEMAPIFSTVNIATDHNQLTMEMMKKVAERHGLICLLHEKPFAGVNGSGKHNNWSLSTSRGENLLNPGDNPAENHRFLLFLAAVIKAVDDYQDLLRLSVATAGNDHRLGANEAPPAIISVFLGDDLTNILTAILEGRDPKLPPKEIIKNKVHTLARLEKDTTDRNRTSPFAFTGNKFEFRMVGSALSIAGPNFVLNTIVAESLEQFANQLEGKADIKAAVMELVKETVEKHRRIIFNGNNYSEEWVEEAERRGLLNLKSAVDALPYFIKEKNVEVFTRHKVLTETEIHSRYEILLENYCKVLHIEALTMLDMAKTQFAPAVSTFVGRVCRDALGVQQFCPDASCAMEKALVGKLSGLSDKLAAAIDALEDALLQKEESEGDILAEAAYYHDNVLPAMGALRAVVDDMEPLVEKSAWPVPTYSELLFSI